MSLVVARHPAPRAGIPALLAPFAALLAPALLAALPSPAHAISNRTLFTPTGAVGGDQLGASVASAGDVNGDGIADVIVGAPANDAGGVNAGRAYVYFGGATADQVADLTLTGVAAGDQFSQSVACAGDVNGDGHDDLIVGAPLNDFAAADAGRAYVFYGGPGADAAADLTLTGAAAGDNFGWSVRGAGDVNGDGFADVIVGAYLNDTAGADAGAAYVYYGGTSPNAVADLTLIGAAVGDLYGWSVAGAGDVNGDGFAEVIVGAYANDAGGVTAGRAYVYFGGPAADAAADLTLTAAAAGDQFGYSVDGAGDVNGDGYHDVIVGAPQNDFAAAEAGRAYVFYGGPSADAVADLTVTGVAILDLLGKSVASAGDLNGDGFGDVFVGADRNDAGGGDAGRAYAFFGGPSADAVADVVLTGVTTLDFFGVSVAGAGDVDGDGYDDLIVGAYLNDAGGNAAGRAYVTAIYPYQVLSPNGGEQWVAGSPHTVRWRGHDPADLAISLDGITWNTLASGVGGADENELTVIAPTLTSTGARVRLAYAGQPASRATSDASDGVFRIVEPRRAPVVATGVQLTPSGEAASDLFGVSVAGAGDVNRDGFADMIAGAYGNDAGGSNAGRAYLYFGGPSADLTPDLTLTGVAANDFLGWSVAGAGDVNGDGYADVIVGAYGNDAGGLGAGRAYVFYGGIAPDATADLTLTGAAAGDNFAFSVAGAGDVNGDGYDDVIVGAYANDTPGPEAGRAYVYFGGPFANATADLILSGAAGSDNLGISVAGAGDVNSDGFDDVIVGANGNNTGGLDAGRAYVYYGGSSPNLTPDLTFTGAAPSDVLGTSVAGAGDVNGDGYADVMAGAPLNDVAGSNSGRAYVYFGGPGADENPDLTLTGEDAADDFGRSVASCGDVNGDGFGDVMVGAPQNASAGTEAGRVYVYFGGPAPDDDADLTFNGAAGEFAGYSVAGSGDVNNDGFPDVLFGAHGNDAGGVDAGRMYQYDCARYFLTSPGGGTTWNVGATHNVVWFGAEPADLWLSTDNGGTYELLRTDVGGSETNVLPLRVPHTPTRFARIMVTPHEPGITGQSESDSSFTIQSSVALLNFTASLGDDGAVLSWSSDPGVGPAGLGGYRLYRLAAGATGGGMRIGPELIVETRYTDAEGAAGHQYRLTAVNGLGAELELGRVSLAPAVSGFQVWPSPVRADGALRVAFAAPNVAPGFPATDLDVGLFDVRGRRVATMARGLVVPQAGVVSIEWPINRLAPGLYFVRAAAPSAGFRHDRKLVVLP